MYDACMYVRVISRVWINRVTRGLVKYVSGRGYFRAVSSQNGDKFVTSPPTPNRCPVQSLSGHANAYRWRSQPRVRRRRASSPQGSFSKGCCHFAGHHGPINVRVSFSTPTYYICMKWTCMLKVQRQCKQRGCSAQATKPIQHTSHCRSH